MGRRASGLLDDPGVPVGDRADPPRARQRQRDPPPARHRVAHVWDSIKPLMQAMDADPARFEGVSILGVDEHVWHHVSTKPIEAGGPGT